MIPTLRAARAIKCPVFEFIDHHTLKHVGLVIDVMKHVFPERVQRAHGNQKAIDAHPQTVGERGHGEGNDENREDGADEDDERLGGHEVEEQPENPDKKGAGVRSEVTEPVLDHGEEEGDEEQVREADEEVGDGEGQGTTEAVRAFFGESGAVFEEGRHVGDGHERHESGAEVYRIDERLNIGLGRAKAQEDRPHKDSQAEVHDYTNAVGNNVAVGFDPRAM